VEEVDRLVRATTRPYPGAFVKKQDNSILRVWSGRISDIDHTIAGPSELIELSDGVYEATDFEAE
jgi:methionyl-tRNA formyltransferase